MYSLKLRSDFYCCHWFGEAYGGICIRICYDLRRKFWQKTFKNERSIKINFRIIPSRYIPVKSQQ